jgi:hypothetical protein
MSEFPNFAELILQTVIADKIDKRIVCIIEQSMQSEDTSVTLSNSLWVYLYNKYIEYVNSNDKDKKSLAYYCLITQYPLLFMDELLAEKKLFLDELNTMLYLLFYGYKGIDKLILSYSNYCRDNTNFVGRHLRIYVSKLKNYELLLSKPQPTFCYIRRCPDCKKYPMLSNECGTCDKINDCTWKFILDGDRCSCGQTIYECMFEHIQDIEWISRQDDQILGYVKMKI